MTLASTIPTVPTSTADHYVDNLAALWAADPDLAALIESGPVADGYSTAMARSGQPTLTVGTAPDDTRLHSRYDPLDEARKLIDTIPVEERLIYIVHGMGLGYHAQLLLDRVSSEATIIVFEPDIDVLRAAVRVRDLTGLVRSQRVLFFTEPDKSELMERLAPLVAAAARMEVVHLRHPPSVARWPELEARFQQCCDDFVSFAKTTVNTLIINGRRTAENVSRNLGWYVASPSVSRLQNAFAGEPAIIVSAGPSIRKNKHLLPQVAGRAVVIAVQTMLKPLLEMGVEPHFVTSLDWSDLSTRFFENLPPGLTTELIAEPKAATAVLELAPQRMTLLGNDFADGVLGEIDHARGRLRSGATVAHLAYYVAEFLGCDPIIFVGQDLGFSDGLCYAPGTSYEDVWRPELGRFCTVEMKQWEQIVRDRPILRRVPDHAGRPSYTEERLFTYLQQFERDFAISRARIIDATEGGVLKRGSTPMTLAEALNQFCDRPLRKSLPRHPGMQWEAVGPALSCLERRRADSAEIVTISRGTLELLREIRNNLGDHARINRAIAKIDGLRSQMRNLSRTYELVTQLTQQTELDRFMADRRINAADISADERQKRQVERDIENVTAIATAAEQFQSLMESAVQRMRDLRQSRGVA